MSDSVGIALAATVDWEALWLALGLLALATALLVLELLVVSFGILLIASIAAAGAAVYYAFAASDAAGWTFTALVPVLAALVVRWGLARIRASRHLVPRSEISADSGYHHVTDRMGVAPGAIGMMVTVAHPSGRARFDGGECDVQAQAGSLERGQRVVVRRIDGPIVYVSPAPEEPDGGEAPLEER